MLTREGRGRASFAAALLGLYLILVPAAQRANAHALAADTPSATAAQDFQGTLHVVRIDNLLKRQNLTHRELRFADGSAVTLHGASAEDLPNGATVHVFARREGDALQAQAVEVLAQPAATTDTVEIEGTLAIAHADDFANGRSHYSYEVRGVTGGVTVLSVAHLPSQLRGGSRVRVFGHRDGNGSLDPETITVESEPATGSSVSSGLVAKAATHNKVLLILANFNNTVAPSLTAAQAQQVMTTNTGSVANFYSEVSYGAQLLDVTVTSNVNANGDWVTMNLAATCDYTQINTQANAAALAPKAPYTAYDATQYDFVVYLFPAQSCGWAGLAYVGFPHQAFINGTGSFITQVVAHEMGHNFGLLHAGSLSCGSAAIGGTCTAAEYGDPWDTMGNNRAMHFNATQKSILGWIPSTSVKTQGAGTTNYTLSPLENGGGATYAVEIPTANTDRTYWIEFRQPIGFDAPLSGFAPYSTGSTGAQIRVAWPFEVASGSDDTEILDMTPGSAGGMADGTLAVGQSFLDSTNGVNIIVTGGSASALTISVTKSAGAATTTTLNSSANPSTVGSSVTFTATVAGSNPTGVVSFKDGASAITGCSAVTLTGSGNSRTAVCATSALSVGAHSIVASYAGDGGNAASSSAVLSQTVSMKTSTTGMATSLTPSTIGASVTFTATVSGIAPTGTVNFKDGANSITGCAAKALAGSGNILTATCATTTLTIGSHGITGVYSGDTSNGGSTSSSLTQTVNKAGASTALASSANPSALGASVTFTATVTGYSPTGGINFTDGGVSIGGCSAIALAGSGNTRTATCTTNALGAATHSIVAHYAGDGNNASSASSTLSQVVSSGAPPSSLANAGFEAPALAAAGYQYAPAGASWTFSAGAGIQHNGSPWAAGAAPEGAQTAFIQSTGTISQAITLAAGTYTLSFSAARRNCCVSPYVQPIKVTMDGGQIGSLISPASTSFAPFSVVFTLSSGGAHTLMFAGTDATDKTTFLDAVSIAPGSATSSSASLASSADPSAPRKNVTFTATVSGVNPTGKVAFTSGGKMITGCGSVALSGSGNSKTAACTTVFPKSGTYAIVASYGGDASNGVASAPLSQSVQRRH